MYIKMEGKQITFVQSLIEPNVKLPEAGQLHLVNYAAYLYAFRIGKLVYDKDTGLLTLYAQQPTNIFDMTAPDFTESLGRWLYQFS